MVDQWGRFKEQQRGRVQDALGFDQTLEVFEPTESYSQSEGYDVSYPDTATATVDAEVVPPEEDADRDEGGTKTDADAVLYVADDTGVSFTDFGETGEAATRVLVVATGEMYVVTGATNQQNGLVKLAAVRV
jgi:hypothetical protein